MVLPRRKLSLKRWIRILYYGTENLVLTFFIVVFGVANSFFGIDDE